jgi:hypothetical protein
MFSVKYYQLNFPQVRTYPSLSKNNHPGSIERETLLFLKDLRLLAIGLLWLMTDRERAVIGLIISICIHRGIDILQDLSLIIWLNPFGDGQINTMSAVVHSTGFATSATVSLTDMSERAFN